MFADDYSNEARFERYCRNGTKFAARNDLSGGIEVWDRALTENEVMQDVAEFIGYHAVHIHPRLARFAGYDGLRFVPRA